MKVHVKRNKDCYTTKIKHDVGEHDAANCQPSKKRKFNEIDDEALEKMLEEQTVDYDRKIAFKIALGKRVDEILGRGKVKQVALSKDMQALYVFIDILSTTEELWKLILIIKCI